MATPNYSFKEATLADNPDFPKASAANYNENLNTIDTILSDSYFNTTLNISEVKVVDFVVATSNLAITWMIFLNEAVSVKQSFVQIMALHQAGTVVFNRFGQVSVSKVDFTVDVDIDSGNLRLKITNNESQIISVNGRRISPFLKTTF